MSKSVQAKAILPGKRITKMAKLNPSKSLDSLNLAVVVVGCKGVVEICRDVRCFKGIVGMSSLHVVRYNSIISSGGQAV